MSSTTNSERSGNGAVRLAFDGDSGVATLTLEMEGRANKINATFGEGLADAVEWALAREGLQGIVIASGHKDFCVGADLDMLYGERDPAALLARVNDLSRLYRRIETCGVPVVAAITGSALGGGYELALACHRRIAVEDPAVQLGLPEVMLGVLPGAGGTQRLSRMLGFQRALELITQGKTVRAPKALAAGLVDELCPDAETVHAAAKRWIGSGASGAQPWDVKGFAPPPPAPGSADARDLFLAACGMVYKKTAGAFPAVEQAVRVVYEGSLLAFDRALEVEARAFVALAVSDQAKDMIRTLWFHRTAAEKHQDLPRTDEPRIEKVGVLGAGMMGGALAWVCAQRGLQVVLKDIAEDPLARARAHCEQLTAKRGRHLTPAEREALLGRIETTLELERMRGCDLVIEAVFEDLQLKHRVTEETEPLLAEGGIWASNTSALPITDLARASKRPQRFIGLHFFSPVEQMPLLEIIRGAQTDDETVARCLAFCRRIKKTPIVVDDGYAFFTTRVFSAYILEGAQLVAEGHPPAVVEWAARSAGMVIGPLQVFDEVTLTLAKHGIEKAAEYQDRAVFDSPAFKLIAAMVDAHQRTGRAAGAGFYDYDGPGGKRLGLWSGLADLVGTADEVAEPEQLGRRLLLIQALEAVRALEAGVLQRHRDAEVGAILGLGFAPNTGGPLSFLDRAGLAEVVAELDQLSERCGPRYAPPDLLRKMAASGETFFEPV